MNRPPLFHLEFFLVCTVSTGSGPATDPLTLQEQFDAGSANGSLQSPGGYESKEVGVAATRALKEGAGVNNSGALVLNADFSSTAPASLAAARYQDGNVAGNDSTSCSDSYFEFEAKGSKSSKEFKMIIQVWRDNTFQGERTGSLATNLTLPGTADTFKTYRVAPDDPTLEDKFDPSGKTWQMTFQIFGANWRAGACNTLMIDNIKVGRKGGA